MNKELDQLLEPEIAGNPETGLLWVRQSLQKLCKAIRQQSGISICCETLRRLLKKRQISLKSNVKRLHPKPHPDREQQFQIIIDKRNEFVRKKQPIISVDTKKKELLGHFANRGKQWCKKADDVLMYDFPSYADGKAVPYGIYDVTHNRGYVAVGNSADTPQFAVDAIVWWWRSFGSTLYPEAKSVLILADGGGSNGYRPRRWKQQLQEKLSDAFGLHVTICHYPTGASKWNPIEHRLFSQISRTWAGTPLTSMDVVMQALKNTTTATGLVVEAVLFDREYEKGLSASDDEMKSLNMTKHSLCSQWNYTFQPRI